MNPSIIEDVFPLSPAQQGMLLLTLAESDPAAHVDQSCMTLIGSIDALALQRAWQWAVDRHPMLRTAFAWQDVDEPVQSVALHACVPFQICEWRGMIHEETRQRLQTFLEADRQQGVSLSQAPLMRLTLIRITEQMSYLVWSRHRLLLDGWSTACLMQEVEVAYQAFSRRQTPVANPPGAYKDYVNWLRNQDWTRSEAFWGAALRGIEGPTPLGRVSLAGLQKRATAYAKAMGRLPQSRMAALMSFSRERRLTLNTLLQGAWAILLSRYSGRSEVLFGSTVAGRPADLPNINTTLGLFINTVPVRVTVPSAARLGSWLAGLQAQNLELRSYEHCSAGQVRSWSKIAGGLPLYESVVVFQNYPGRPSGSKAAPKEAIDDYAALRSDYPLMIHALAGSELLLALVFDTGRFDKSDGERILAHLRGILTSIALCPDSHVGQLLEAISKDEVPWVRPADNRRLGNAPLVAPRSDLERAVAGIWRDLLGVAELGIDDNFFALRGHSLLAMRLISRIRDTFQVEVPLSRLFASPTIAGLSATIEEAILAEIEQLSEEEAQWQSRESSTSSV